MRWLCILTVALVFLGVVAQAQDKTGLPKPTERWKVTGTNGADLGYVKGTYVPGRANLYDAKGNEVGTVKERIGLPGWKVTGTKGEDLGTMKARPGSYPPSKAWDSSTGQRIGTVKPPVWQVPTSK